MTSKKNYKELDLQKRGKLRYLERIAQEEEAEQEIANYLEEEEYKDNDDKIQNTIRQ